MSTEREEFERKDMTAHYKIEIRQCFKKTALIKAVTANVAVTQSSVVSVAGHA